MPETITSQQQLLEALSHLVTAITYADPPRLFNNVLCHEARVPVEFVTNATEAIRRAQSESPNV